MICKECGVEIRAETHKPPIWGVLRWKDVGCCESYYFCSKQHGNKWVKEHNGYQLVERVNA